MLKKPESKNELLPPFRWIGEDGWEEKARQILLDYEVPLPQPSTAEEIQQCEERLGVILPEPFKLFHENFGAVAFDCPLLFPLSDVRNATEVWFYDFLSEQDKMALSDMVLIGNPADDYLVLDLKTGRCAGCYHDPPGFADWLPSFHELIQCAFIGLCCRYYGWPDESLEKWSNELKFELYGVRF